MGLMKLLLVGLVGGGAAYLARNPQARQAAATFAQDLVDVGLEMIPPKYADLAAQMGLGRRGGEESTWNQSGTVVEGQYAPRTETTNPPPTVGGI